MTLLIDADDTLWENIVVFNAVNQKYVDWIAPDKTVAEMQEHLDALQVEFIAEHGYGRETFEKSLLAGVERFAGRSPTPECRDRVSSLVQPLKWDTLDLLDGVAETLEVLSTRHELILVTKGDLAEQQHKVDRSGLAHFFDAVEILESKSPSEYAAIMREHGLNPGSSWMVGNSPRSDITPALQVGLGAVLIAHAATWSHEQAELPEHPRLRQLPSFRDLTEHF